MKHKPNKSTKRIHADHLRVVPKRKLIEALRLFGKHVQGGSIWQLAADEANRNEQFRTFINRRTT